MIFSNHDNGILDEATSIVGSSKMLVHENTEYFPELVIIRESKEKNCNIIRIEDLMVLQMALKQSLMFVKLAMLTHLLFLYL